MELLVLVVLGGAGLWILVSELRSQQGAVPRSSVDSFRRSMTALGRNRRVRRRVDSGSGRTVLVLSDPQRVVTPQGRPAQRPRAAAPPRGPGGRTADGWVATRRPATPGSRRSARGGRPQPTSAARRRGAVMRALVGAVTVSAVAWGALGAVGAVLLAVSLLALVAYFALLASVRQTPPASRARGPAPPGAGRPPVDAAGRPAATHDRVADDGAVARGA